MTSVTVSDRASREVATVQDVSSIETLRPDWSAAALEHGNLYLTPEWILSLWESHFDRRGVEFLVLSDPAFRGLVPLVLEPIRKHGIPFRQYGLVTNRYGRNHNELLLRGDAASLLRTVLAEIRGRRGDLLLVGSVAEDSPLPSLLTRAGAEERFRVVREPYVRSPYLTIVGSWDGYLSERSGNFRSDLKRKTNKAARAGVEFRKLTRPEEVPLLLDTVYTIETKSWKEQTQTSITTNPTARAFYDRFLPRAAAAGWLESFLVFMEGKSVAYDMGVRFANRYYMLKTSYDTEWSEWSPGVVLRQHVVRHLFETGAREHDFLGDDEPWKMRWTASLRHHHHYYLYDRRRWIPSLYSRLREARTSRPKSG